MRMAIYQMQRPIVRNNAIARCLLPVAALLLLTSPAPRAQDSQGESSSTAPKPLPPGAPDSNRPSKPSNKKSKDTPTNSAPDQPTWDPLRAEKDLEVGQFYLKKGDLDAAIDRFQDAAAAKPGFAIPYRYLGEAQEKRGDKREALKSYRRYLDLYPHAEDAKKIQKKIDKLWSEVVKKDKSTG
ncbi:MAG TPA: tetratricopeptide repeat protein [Candidatus Acidoferrum sp.]|nr:tetratricopeptide repeat protein [Candidatus Acidoferrum sp.]